jgi:hypothetical protein
MKLARIAFHFLAVALLYPSTASVADKKMPADEVVANHLDAIGNAEARAAVKSRVALGTVVYGEAISGRVHQEGPAQLFSAGNKMRVEFQLRQPQYPGERFIFDGRKSDIAEVAPGSRSVLGGFLYVQESVLAEGLFGGALFTGWTLFTAKERGAKISAGTVKKIDGRELIEVSYSPKKHGDPAFQIRLYFEPETFRHVRTVYTLTTPHSMASSATTSARDDTGELREILEERFSDFKDANGLTLPSRWEIRFYREPATSFQERQWAVQIVKLTHNTLTQ